MKKYIRPLKWPALISGTLILLICLVFLFFQTDLGREKILSIINRSLEEASIRIKIKKTGGTLPFSFMADQLEVSDRDGVFLVVRDITFRLSASALLKGRIHIRELSVDSVTLGNLPRGNKKEISDQQKISHIPGIFFRTEITSLMINHLKIPESILGKSMDFRIIMSLTGDNKLYRNHIKINVERIDKAGSRMFFNAVVSGDQADLTLTAGIDDRDGLIAGLMGSRGKTELSLTGNGTLTDWSGTLEAKVENIASLESVIGLQLDNDKRLKLSGGIEFTKGLISENAQKIIGDRTNFSIETSVKKKRNLEFDRLEFKTENVQVSLSGNLDIKDLSTKGNFDINLNDLSVAEQYIKRKCNGNVRINGKFAGPLLSPEVISDINIIDLETGPFKAEGVTAKLNLTMKQNRNSTLPLFHVILNGDFNNAAIRSGSTDFSEEKITLNLDITGPDRNNFIFNKINITGKDAAISVSGGFNQSLKILSAEGKIDLNSSDANIFSNRGSLTGSGTYDFSYRSVDSRLSVKIPQLEKLSPVLGIDLKGSGQLNAEIKGPIDRIELKSKALFKNLSLNENKLDSLSGEINISGKTGNKKGNLNIVLKRSSHSIEGKSFFKLKDNTVNFSKLEINGSGIKLEGDLLARIDESLYDGNLRLTCDDFTALSSFLGEDISGSLYMDGVFHKGGKDINIDMNIMGVDLVSRFVNAEKLVLKAGITGSLDSPQIKSHMTLKSVKKGNLIFDTIDTQADGTVDNVDFEVKGSGSSAHEFKIDIGGTYISDEIKQELRVKYLQADYEALPLNLIKPFSLTKSTHSIDLDNIELNFDRGIIKSSGNLTDDNIKLAIEYKDVPLNCLSLFGIPEMKGLSSGSILVGGSLSEPVITNKIDADFQWVLPDQYDESSPIQATLNTIYNSGNLHADLKINGTKPGTFSGSMDVPLMLSIMPFSYSLDNTGQINGALSGLIKMSNIAPLIETVDHHITGDLNMDLKINGTVALPKISGRADLINGGYENLKTGTILREIKMEISAEPPKINITEISAIDALGGKVIGRGWIDTRSEMKFPYTLEFDLNDFTLAHNDTLTINAGGKSTLSGSSIGHKLNGSIRINRAELNIPDKLPPEISELDVIEINVEENPASHEPVKIKKKEPKPVKLELSVKSPGRVFVNGKGLTSEWNGGLEIKGSAASPVVTGKLSIVRGYYLFLGKRLQLTKGNIYFDGEVPVSPGIDITAETESNDINVIIYITGDLNNPEFKMESEPYLPSDEIFSRLLFGTSASQITPIQAIQLANAVNTFIKGGKGFNILDKTRKFLMVDQLEIRQAEGDVRGSTISAGKYIKDDIYLEVEKGLGSESGSASIKWELTPSITVETEVNAKDETEAGINWKKDY